MIGPGRRSRIRTFSSSMKPLFMLTMRPLLAVALLSFTTLTSARDIGPQLATAQERYRAGDFDSALKQLEPLLSADDLDQPTKQHVRELASRVLQMRGEEHFRHARVAKS